MRSFSRRDFLITGGGAYAALVLGACGSGDAGPVTSSDASVRATERRRRKQGAKVHEVDLSAVEASVNLAGLTAATWAYDGAVPGPELRVKAGDVIRARFTNKLTQPTTIHWHGIALRNDMDGVAGVTQPAVTPGGRFTYEFTVPDPGTYWFHPHVGLQLDRGLYAPLIVEDPAEPGGYDRELTIVLDDWVDGIGSSPDEKLAALRRGEGGHAEHLQDDEAAAGLAKTPLRGAGGDVSYPLFLINGRPPKDPQVFEAKPGERLRLRLINAGADTPFRVALGGHRLTVTHTDGFPVEPVAVDALIIGMSERYDVLVTVSGAGVFPLVAVAENKGNQALAVIRSGPGDAPPPDARPAELDGRLLALDDLQATPAVSLARKKPDRTHRVVLGGGTDRYRWTINGKTADDMAALELRQGERVRLAFENRTTMFHPMHLHGHTFQVVRAGVAGPRKDSMIIRPKERVSVDFQADNPGQWVLHCHNIYHMEGGMETILSYVS